MMRSRDKPAVARKSFLCCFSLQAGVSMYGSIVFVVLICAALYNITAEQRYSDPSPVRVAYTILYLYSCGCMFGIIFLSTGSFLLIDRIVRFGGIIVTVSVSIWTIASVLCLVPQSTAFRYLCIDDRCPSTHWMYSEGFRYEAREPVIQRNGNGSKNSTDQNPEERKPVKNNTTNEKQRLLNRPKWHLEDRPPYDEDETEDDEFRDTLQGVNRSGMLTPHIGRMADIFYQEAKQDENSRWTYQKPPQKKVLSSRNISKRSSFDEVKKGRNKKRTNHTAAESHEENNTPDVAGVNPFKFYLAVTLMIAYLVFSIYGLYTIFAFAIEIKTMRDLYQDPSSDLF